MKQDSQNKNSETVVTRDGEEVIRKRKKHKHRSKKTPTAVKVLIAVGIVIVIGIIGVFAFFLHGAASVKNPAGNTGDVSVQQTIEYKGEKYALNEDMVTILFIGHDDSATTSDGVQANEADAIMALALDTSTGKTTAIGIPRDTMCLVDKYSQGEFVNTVKEQICLAYGYGETPEAGSENVVKSARNVLLNVPIKYYYTIDEDAIAALNDAIGGVTLTPLQTIPGTDIVEGEETVLFGKFARKYVQYRDTSVMESSKDRQDRGIQYVKAFADQAFDSPNGAAKKISDLLSIIGDYSVTNISPSELTYLSNTMAGDLANGIEVKALKGDMTQNGRYVETTLDEDALYKTVLDTYYKKVS